MKKEKRRRDLKNTVQNLLIIVLSCSAFFLFMKTAGVFSSKNVSLQEIFSGNADTLDQNVNLTKLTDISAPVHITVTGVYGRYGNLSFTTTDENFSSLGALLREALGSAGTFASCTESQFRSALGTTGVYYDFCADLPLSILGGMVGTKTQEISRSARRVLLSSENGGVKLYLAGGNSFCCCTTRVPKADLTRIINSYQLGNASFAFELASASKLAPYSLLLTGEQPSYPKLNASNPLKDTTSGLLTAFGFNPRTKSRYPESGGTQVIVDGNRTLRIQTDGTVLYQGGDNASLKISTGKKPSEQKIVLGCYELLSSALGIGENDAFLCLQDIQQNGKKQVLQFNYQMNGTLILRSSGAPAVKIVLSGTTVSSISLYARQYTISSNKSSLILPLKQALAIAGKHAGAELSIGYSDAGDASIPAGWLIT